MGHGRIGEQKKGMSEKEMKKKRAKLGKIWKIGTEDKRERKR